ncbi:hypothetical protein EIK76_00195 [Rheinheimera mesophila]|uniref:Uncharacterized protein n=1 Tax=Rheinheimera mesophila TaxID=1547515 RepID=A0A3P3QMV8_9GAMM|nr:hypothetical protein [Rheinheimera mesophila]KKL00286.1 hypothetical protein SD53_15950 [Rheinheimera mesophila]RRJ22541.1 hypothetical protein EIK76_00195 [Rheinheimera mesophila]
MNRWQDTFKNHEFQTIWAQIVTKSESLTVDDVSVLSNVEEVARLKKVVSFISSLLDSIDPDLVPLSTWANFTNQCHPCHYEISSYISNRNIGHIVNANKNNLDNLLTYVRPYAVNSDAAAKAAAKASREYTKTMYETLDEFKRQTVDYSDEFKAKSAEISVLKDNIVTQFNDLKEIHKQIEQLRVSYFEGSDTNEPVASTVDNLVNSINNFHQNINSFHTELLGSGSDSIANKIKLANDTAKLSTEQITNLLAETEKQLKDLRHFYVRVVGKEDDSGKFVGGLQDELNARQAALDDFKQDQELRYTALNKQIESLLPGATSAGLATAYRAMRKSFRDPIKEYSKLFYISVATLSSVAFISTIDSLFTDGHFIQFVDISNIGNLLSNLAYKLPIMLPILWLALFASKRRNESQRLQQEYAHKEALAKSYQSFKKQIDNLQDGNKEQLLEKLLAAAIDAVAANASHSLDGKHDEKTPIHIGVDKTFEQLEKIKSLIQFK